MRGEIKLRDGDRVAIIGGGPAGSFFAHFIHKFARLEGIHIKTVIFDGKDFLQKGPRGCNLCAGVLSESLVQKLKDEGIHLPEKRIISRVEGYILHIDGDSLPLLCSENEKDTIATVFRGNGPRFSTFQEVISFDDFLMKTTQELGTEIFPSPVWDIELPENRSERIIISHGNKDNPQKTEADLVVGAFGVNAYMMDKVKDLGFGYNPPSTLSTFQAELKLGREKILENFGNTIHVYMPKTKTLRYATVIPKDDYITVTVIGKRDATKDMLQKFLALKDVQGKIPFCQPHCFCLPRIIVSPAKKPYTDRFVVIGDASYSRHYKNGIESAFLTARLAAQTAVLYGVDAASFKSYYHRLAKKQIIRDNIYGRLLFFISRLISSVSLLSKAHLKLAKKRQLSGPPQKIRALLWNMFTGNIPYRDIFKISLDLSLHLSLLFNTLVLLAGKLKKNTQ
jgi:flavin-dependent dehydrogenase